MTNTMDQVRRRVHKHTERALFDYCNHGHGANVKEALRSARRLINWIEKQLTAASKGPLP
jgi:hypothetical protein